MIHITAKEKCCGCQACEQVCPKGCITMQADREGFNYPVVNVAHCVQCGLCETVCPVLNPYPLRHPIRVQAVRSLDEDVRQCSSSGGLFTELAHWILAKGGVIFGARLTADWRVVHDYVENESDLAAFRGSKYVQSEIGDSFKRVRTFLKEGRWVLFVGTSCQVSALLHFLNKRQERLLTVDVVCHGVPSVTIWQTYLKYITQNALGEIRQIRFRDKENGWKNYCFVCEWKGGQLREVFRENAFMKAYLSNSLLRPSCYHCPCKSFASESDLTLADYWGVQDLQPELDDDRGIGLAFVHTQQMSEILSVLPLAITEVRAPLGELIKYNPSIERSVRAPLPLKRFVFYRLLACKVPFAWLVKILLRNRGIVGFLKSIIGKK